jgi:hypothetical protein
MIVQLLEVDFITRKSSNITPAMPRITRITQGSAPCGTVSVFLFGLAGLNLAITAMVAPGGKVSA